MKNAEIAAAFGRIADALEIRGDSGFKVQAYRKAARVIGDLTEDIARVAAEDRLESVPGIGTGIARKITEYLKTGSMARLREALSAVPPGLLELLEIPGVGGRTIHLMHEELGVEDLAGLRRVVVDGSLAGLRGMGEKKVDNIRRGMETRERVHRRMSIHEAVLVADALVAYLAESPLVGRVAAAGSLRRMKETVGDIDILATGRKGAAVIRRFTAYPETVRVLAEGNTKGSIIVRTGSAERQVDLRLVKESEYGAALLYFTGSKAHNIKLRGMAKDRGMKISEYGIFKGAKKLAGRTEEDVYSVLGLPLIPPEMREDRGEIELALEGRLPAIVAAGDIRGDLHVHTKASDGTMTLEEIAGRARSLGYAYVAICDHSRSVQYAHGLSLERLAEQMREIERLNRGLKGLRLLKGSEVDILADGNLDLPDEVLAKLDFVVAAIHSGFRKDVTARMLKAMENPYVTTIAHPTGRLISGREGYDVDIDKVLDGAKRLGKALELNAYYDRLDLNEHDLTKARERGIRISIGTDTHTPGGMEMMRFGVGVARRAWLRREDILNCGDPGTFAAGARDLTRRRGRKPSPS
jgi:DNA polymerase (family 10)